MNMNVNTNAASTPVLDGKTIVVTGAGRGQGAAETAALLEAGAVVVACDLAWPDDGPASAEHERLLRRELDVSDPAAWAALAEELGQRGDGIVHGLVNNAGVTHRARLGDVELEDWNRVFAVNVSGPLLGIQTLMPLMTEGGSIINIGSLAAVTAHAAVSYTSSKWALRGLTHTASMQLGPRGIRVNLLNPGYIETPMTGAAPDSFRRANLANTPVGRLGAVGDIVPLVLFLLSDAAAFITGAEIPVDGGQAAHGGAKYIYDFEAMEARTGAGR
jgi:3alpha(or 20beta)-hydroxysteroid dehydrogenase